MKQFLLLILLLVGKFTYADALDEVRIYINQKLVATTYEGASQVLELEVSVGDTLRFEVRTDWGGTNHSSISVFEYQSSEKIGELLQIPMKGDGADFRTVISPKLMYSEMLFVFNFDPAVNRTWKFARIILKERTD